MIEYIFMDLDETILDFHKAEHMALKKALDEMNICSEEWVLDRYSVLNLSQWKLLEQKKITREQVKINRYILLFCELVEKGVMPPKTESEIEDLADCAAKIYENHLSNGHFFLEDAEDVVKRLSEKYKLYIVSNGTARVQYGRLMSADISQYFEKIFISEELGFNKPDKRFFDECFSQIDGFDKARSLIVGDSLSSDIVGGKNAGIMTVWLNLNGKSELGGEIMPDHTINHLRELESVIKKAD